MNKKQKVMRNRIILTGIVYIPLFILDHNKMLMFLGHPIFRLILFLIPYLMIGWDVIYRAMRNITKGQVFDENFLMCIATIGAIGVKEYSEAVAVMLFYQIGELFQTYAVNRSRQSIGELMKMCPEYANAQRDGSLFQVEPDEVAIGEIIVIKAGERIPLDGVIVSGHSFVDTSALTGEAIPKEVIEGQEIISGCVNGSGLLEVKVAKEYDDSTVAKILELVENASSKKAKVENFISKFAKVYTPIVVCAAFLLAVCPPILLGKSFSKWMVRACIFLVVSCPCALVISVPMSFFGGIGAASRKGILVKGSNYLEILARMKTIVFDKTGTLTKGEFQVTKIQSRGIPRDELLELAALVEGYSTHPVAEALRKAYKKEVEIERVKDVYEIPGKGIQAKIDGITYYVGNGKLMRQKQISFQESTEMGTSIYLAKEKEYLGFIVICDIIKKEATEAVDQLKKNGVTNTVMLTGDRAVVGEAVAKELKIDKVYADLLPGDKVYKVEELLHNLKSNEKLAFVGDGVNDAPVLARADVGIAMGTMGSDAAIEAADIVLMDDDPRKITDAIIIARKTIRIVKQNIIFALTVKMFVLLLGAIGMANMWEAVFADVGVSVIAILNAMRTLHSE